MVDEKFTLAQTARIMARLDQIFARLEHSDQQRAALGAEVVALAAQVNTVHEDVRMRNAYVNQSEASLRRAARRHAVIVDFMNSRMRRMMIIVTISTACATATGFAAGIVFLSNAITWGWFR